MLSFEACWPNRSSSPAARESMGEEALSSAIVECGRISLLIERKAPPRALLEPLTSLILYLRSFLETRSLEGYLAEEVRSALDSLQRCREGLLRGRSEALNEAINYVEVCRGILRSMLSLRGAREVYSILIDLRESVQRGVLTGVEAHSRLSEAAIRMRKLPLAREALEKLEILQQYFATAPGELVEEVRDAIVSAINQVIFYLSREDVLRRISEDARAVKPEIQPVRVVVAGESFVARTPFFIGREPTSKRLCIRDAGRFVEAEVELVVRKSEELRLEADFFPPVHVFSTTVDQGVSRLQAYIYAHSGILYLIATGRRPMAISREGVGRAVTRGYYSGEIVELGTRARIEMEGALPIELQRELAL